MYRAILTITFVVLLSCCAHSNRPQREEQAVTVFRANQDLVPSIRLTRKDVREEKTSSTFTNTPLCSELFFKGYYVKPVKAGSVLASDFFFVPYNEGNKGQLRIPLDDCPKELIEFIASKPAGVNVDLFFILKDGTHFVMKTVLVHYFSRENDVVFETEKEMALKLGKNWNRIKTCKNVDFYFKRKAVMSLILPDTPWQSK